MNKDPWQYIENPDNLTVQRLINILQTYPPDAKITVAVQVAYDTPYACDAIEAENLLLRAIETQDTRIALNAWE